MHKHCQNERTPTHQWLHNAVYATLQMRRYTVPIAWLHFVSPVVHSFIHDLSISNATDGVNLRQLQGKNDVRHMRNLWICSVAHAKYLRARDAFLVMMQHIGIILLFLLMQLQRLQLQISELGLQHCVVLLIRYKLPLRKLPLVTNS